MEAIISAKPGNAADLSSITPQLCLSMLQKEHNVPIIPYDKLSSVTWLANGGFGAVYKAKWGPVDVVIKKVHDQRQVTLEAKTLKKVSACHSVVGFYGLTLDRDIVGIVMEFCPTG